MEESLLHGVVKKETSHSVEPWLDPEASLVMGSTEIT